MFRYSQNLSLVAIPNREIPGKVAVFPNPGDNILVNNDKEFTAFSLEEQDCDKVVSVISFIDYKEAECEGKKFTILREGNRYVLYDNGCKVTFGDIYLLMNDRRNFSLFLY